MLNKAYTTLMSKNTKLMEVMRLGGFESVDLCKIIMIGTSKVKYVTSQKEIVCAKLMIT